jgi:hypothetical protein
MEHRVRFWDDNWQRVYNQARDDIFKRQNVKSRHLTFDTLRELVNLIDITFWRGSLGYYAKKKQWHIGIEIQDHVAGVDASTYPVANVVIHRLFSLHSFNQHTQRSH